MRTFGLTKASISFSDNGERRLGSLALEESQGDRFAQPGMIRDAGEMSPFLTVGIQKVCLDRLGGIEVSDESAEKPVHTPNAMNA